MPERMIFLSQIELSTAASSPKEAVRKQEFDAHVNNDSRHLPSGGMIGQVLVVTTTGLAWRWPHVVCGCGPGTITFEDTLMIGGMIQGVDINALREVEIV